MNTNDITTGVLTTIRRDIADLRADMDAGFQRVDARMDRMEARLDERIDSLGDQLGHRITETEIRLSTEINAMAGTLHDVHSMLLARSRRRGPDDSHDD